MNRLLRPDYILGVAVPLAATGVVIYALFSQRVRIRAAAAKALLAAGKSGFTKLVIEKAEGQAGMVFLVQAMAGNQLLAAVDVRKADDGKFYANVLGV